MYSDRQMGRRLGHHHQYQQQYNNFTATRGNRGKGMKVGSTDGSAVGSKVGAISWFHLHPLSSLPPCCCEVVVLLLILMMMNQPLPICRSICLSHLRHLTAHFHFWRLSRDISNDFILLFPRLFIDFSRLLPPKLMSFGDDRVSGEWSTLSCTIILGISDDIWAVLSVILCLSNAMPFQLYFKLQYASWHLFPAISLSIPLLMTTS